MNYDLSCLSPLFCFQVFLPIRYLGYLYTYLLPLFCLQLN